jgi:regulator of sigma E protease
VSFVASLVSLAFLIVVHEAGHYFVARWCGMRIERFSIGFGPGILKRRSKKTGTVFQLAPIPFGGFVEIRGMNIAEEVEPDDKFAYPNRPAWQRFVTIFAGPATNYLSAVVIMFALYTCNGMHSPWRFFGVGAVNHGYDAEGKLEEGDRILAVDDVPILADGTYQPPDGSPAITAQQGDTLSGRVNAKNGAPITLTIVRNGNQMKVTVRPKLQTAMFLRALGADGATIDQLAAQLERIPKDKRSVYLLGIAPIQQSDLLRAGVGETVVGALEFPIAQTQAIANGLWGIIAKHEPADPRGPIGILDEFSNAWKLGPRTGIELLAMLSVYLGLFNLFPLPALDGGRLAFLLYEMVTRRRANPKIEAMVHMVGIMVLGVVMILVTLRDVHLFS